MEHTRREFISAGAAAAAFGLAGCRTQTPAWKPDPNAEIWAAYLQFGRNMWSDVPVPEWGGVKGDTPEKRKRLMGVVAADHIRFDENVFRNVTAHMAKVGMNMVVIDIGEALEYPSHPELAVKGSWKPDRFRRELARLRSLGLEPIPKLNFSTGHDTWLGVYQRMVSTPTYYKVCADLIADVCDIFDTPRFFHLGYDEETAANQRFYDFVCVRQGELWWHDFLFLSGEVERRGVRPWIWSDRVWHHEKEFVSRMPKSVLQSNWYYGANFDLNDPKMHPYSRQGVRAYLTLEKAGFDQVPCGSTHNSDANVTGTVKFAREHISKNLLKGFLLAAWVGGMEPQNEAKHMHAIDVMAEAMKIS